VSSLLSLELSTFSIDLLIVFYFFKFGG
jgi:hypothetical protein